MAFGALFSGAFQRQSVKPVYSLLFVATLYPIIPCSHIFSSEIRFCTAYVKWPNSIALPGKFISQHGVSPAICDHLCHRPSDIGERAALCSIYLPGGMEG